MNHGSWCHTHTFPLNCRYCQQRIFFFSCNCGSRVMFDELGPPWPTHDCQTQSGNTTPYSPSTWATPNGVRIFRKSQNTSGLLPGWQRGSDSIDSNLVKRVSESQSLARDTMRIDPIGRMTAEIVGVVRERSGPDLARRHGLERNSIGFKELANVIGDSDPVQLTAQVDDLPGDPDAIDYSSYTFLLPRKLAGREITQGAVIQALLAPVVTLSGIRLWVARKIEILY